jgi:hypothetical protein
LLLACDTCCFTQATPCLTCMCRCLPLMVQSSTAPLHLMLGMCLTCGVWYRYSFMLQRTDHSRAARALLGIASSGSKKHDPYQLPILLQTENMAPKRAPGPSSSQHNSPSSIVVLQTTKRTRPLACWQEAAGVACCCCFYAAVCCPCLAASVRPAASPPTLGR